MRQRRLNDKERRRLTETDRAELVANAIGKMIDAADLTSNTIQKMLLACLVCEMKNASRTLLAESFPHEQVRAEIVLQHERPIDRPVNRDGKAF